jgi:hypothetical protein
MNLKLKAIKEELRKMLLEMSVVKTDNGVLQYEGDELKEGTVVKIVNEDGTVEIPTGEFTTEDYKKLIVENGTVKAIEEIEIQPVEVVEPAEEETTEPTAEPTEEIVAEPTEEETTEPIEEPTEDVVEEPKEELTALEVKVAELEAKIAELEAKLTEGYGTLFSTIEKMSMAKPAAQEFESVKKMEKTGVAKIDNFLEKFGK